MTVFLIFGIIYNIIGEDKNHDLLAADDESSITEKEKKDAYEIVKMREFLNLSNKRNQDGNISIDMRY